MRASWAPAIIGHAVWLSCRFALSYRDVEELRAERGVLVTDETIRHWCRKFGQHYANALRRRRLRPGDEWHLDAVFITINGATHSLWRAVDQDGQVLAILVQRRRLRKGLRYVPRVLLTDTLASDGAAHRELLPRVAPRRHKGLNNRAEHAHQPTRERERRMAALHEPGPRATFPGRLWAHHRAFPPAPPPPDRHRLPPGQNGPLRHLAGEYRHPGHGLILQL